MAGLWKETLALKSEINLNDFSCPSVFLLSHWQLTENIDTQTKARLQ